MKMFSVKSLIFSFILANTNLINAEDTGGDYLIVETTNGKVRGTISATIDKNTPYIAFRGIPYAKPPTGELRFKPPEPANNWTDVRNASKDGSACVQNIPITGSEDCLFINVYTPKFTRDENLLPVLVWIYGGAFISGDSSYESFGPDYFLNERLMFVSFNYRLGVFGFLSTQDLISPGNYGLKDQILALKWVQNNIRAFGGNPNNVTIFGESAGAASVSYLVQSHLTAGLYQRAISNSGNSLCQWALTRRPRQIAERIAKSLLISTSSSTSIVDGLRGADYKKLHETAFRVEIFELVNNFLHGLIFSPTIEPVHDGAVLPGKSYELLQNRNYNKVAYLMGFNSKEAAGWLDRRVIFNIPVSLLGAPILESYDANITRLIPEDMNVRRAQAPFVAVQIRNKYLRITELIVLNPRKFENFVSDDQFVRPVRRIVRFYSRDVDVYYYRFSYMGNLGLSQSDPKRYSTAGVSHAEDLNYLFRINSSVTEGSFEDFRTRYRLVRMWSNFAKYGNPTPDDDQLLQNVKWPVTRNASSNENLNYLDIGENLKVMQNPSRSILRFWDNLYAAYGHRPFDTY